MFGRGCSGREGGGRREEGGGRGFGVVVFVLVRGRVFLGGEGGVVFRVVGCSGVCRVGVCDGGRIDGDVSGGCGRDTIEYLAL